MAQKFKEGQTGNFGKANLESIDRRLEEPIPNNFGVMFTNETGNGEKVTITKESRKKCAKSLIR